MADAPFSAYYHEGVEIEGITVSGAGEAFDAITRPAGPIDLHGTLETLDPAAVESLARSIKENGLLEPIGLTEQHELLYGRTRLMATWKLGRQKIEAKIYQGVDAVHQELITLEENLERRELTHLERCRLHARAKEIYETLYPETKSVRERGGPGRGKKKTKPESSLVLDGGEDSSPGGGNGLDDIPFSQEASKLDAADIAAGRVIHKPPPYTAKESQKQRRSLSAVKEDVQIGSKLVPQAADLLAGTKPADSKSQLKVLSNLMPKHQVAVAKVIESGKAENVKGAMGQLDLLAKAKPASVGKQRGDAHRALTALIHRLDAMGLTAKLEKPLKQIAALIGGE